MGLHWLKTLTGVSLAAFLALPLRSSAQEPSANLKQADADYRAGVAALSHNDLKTARTDFETVVRLAPSAEQGHSALGAVLVRLGENSAGIAELEKALAMKAGDTTAQQNLALAFEQAGQPARAIPWFARLEAAARAAQKPLPAEVLAAYARSLAATHQDEMAIAKMKQAIAEAPRNGELWDELGSLYGERQDWPGAQHAFNSALQIDPALAVAHFHLGMTLDAQQQAGGIDELSKACDLAPDNADFLLALGQALTAQGKDAEAIPVLQRAVQINPGHRAASYQLGLALQRVNQVNDAIPLFEKAVVADPTNAEVLTNLGMALCQAQRAKDAVPVLQRAVTLAPQNPTAHQDLAAAYIQLSQFNDAVGELRAALKLSPDASQLHYNLGLAFKMGDDGADAIPEFEAAEKLDPAASEPPYALGLLYLQDGRYADAEHELNASLKLQPANGDGWATLGSVENHLDRLPEAASALQEAIRQRPDQPDPLLTLAAVLVKQNQPAQAAEERKKAAELMRTNMNRQRAEVAGNSGNDMLKKGSISDAIVDFRDALSYDPDYVEAHIGLANALQQQGKIAEAAAERQRAEALEKQSQQQAHP
jgi:tetratricopeptide (TPR) repeat protein